MALMSSKIPAQRAIVMDIIVLVKQVPNTAEVKIDPKTGTLMREGVESIINPDDMHALEAALRLREAHGGKVTAVSMGPPQAMDALREALGMGVDGAVLLTDRAFAGADTLATSYTLGKCVRKLGHFDLVIAGHQAIDGDTAQIGPQVAEFLDVPQIIRASKLDVKGDELTAERTAEDGTEVLRCRLPALVTVTKEANKARYPYIPKLMAAFDANAPVMVWGPRDIGADEARIGLKGSPTQVQKTFTPKFEKKVEKLSGQPAEVAKALVERLRQRRLL
jgi:electron transfer flavoprotein beta subunit